MSNSSTKWRPGDFCTVEEGLDYVFARMSAIYGAVFTRHWEGVDASLVRQVWAEECGRMLTYRPKLDYALKYMNPDRPPSALAFKNFLISGPSIPDKPHFHLAHRPTEEEMEEERERAEAARAKVLQMVKKMRIEK